MRLPLFGKLHHRLALARFARALEALYTAGIGLPEGLRNAAEASGDVALARQVHTAAGAMAEGGDPAQALAVVRRLPADVTAMLATGLESGKLDEMLQHVAAKQEDAAAATAKVLAVLAPVLAMLVIGGLLVYFILSFFLQGYLQPIQELLGPTPTAVGRRVG